MDLNSDEKKDLNIIIKSLKPDSFLRIFFSIFLIFPIINVFFNYIDGDLFFKDVIIGGISIISIVIIWITYIISYKKYIGTKNKSNKYIVTKWY